MDAPATVVLEAADLDALLEALRERGYTVIGPAARDGAIHYDELDSAADLPQGWIDEQSPGSYRLRRGDDETIFGYTVGPQSWKRTFHPPEVRLFSARRANGGFEIQPDDDEGRNFALIGVRPCELRAIQVQDRVFLGDRYVDPHYAARRGDAFIVAVNCGRAGGTCFCVSMQSGPRAESGFDLALTEVIDTDRHYFVVEVGSDAGASVCDELPVRTADAESLRAAEQAVARAAEQMQKSLDTDDLPAILQRNLEHPRWDEVADRCLACGNCTMVCPTCFCTSVEDVTELGTDDASRVRHWDSCFTSRFSYVHGGSVRQSVRSRYRQWLTHKLGTWHDQFGESGCVGCGRCVTWCPVGIDITEEAAAIRAGDRGGTKTGEDQ